MFSRKNWLPSGVLLTLSLTTRFRIAERSAPSTPYSLLLKMADKDARKDAIIKNADMSEDMTLDAIECAAEARDKFSIEKDIAA